MVKLKRVYEVPQKNDGYRILVDRLWPRGISKATARIDLWLKDIGPSDQLRKWFGHKPERWADFARKYRAELRKKKDLLAQIKRLEQEHKRVTLVYSAKDELRNQAVVLGKILK